MFIAASLQKKKRNPHLNAYFLFEKDLNLFVYDALNRPEAIW